MSHLSCILLQNFLVFLVNFLPAYSLTLLFVLTTTLAYFTLYPFFSNFIQLGKREDQKLSVVIDTHNLD